MQFLESVGSIPSSMNLNDIEANCNNWRAYAPTDPFKQVGSGL